MLTTINIWFILIFTYCCICWGVGELLFEDLFRYSFKKENKIVTIITYILLPILFPIRLFYWLLLKILH